jgi:hypothetical protein
MSNQFDKVDEIVKRTGCSYEEAKAALEEAEEDMLAALILIEKSKSKGQKFKAKSDDIVDEIKKVIKEANATKLVVLREGETIINIPISAGAVGVVLAPLFSVAGLTAAMLSKCTIEIYTADGHKININDKLDKSIGKIKDEIDHMSKK